MENRQKLMEIMCRNADTYSEQDILGEAPYFHIRVSTGSVGISAGDFINDAKITVKCCKGNEIDPDNLQICISTESHSLW